MKASVPLKINHSVNKLAAVQNLSFDTPKGKSNDASDEDLPIRMSEVDFLLGRDGGRPSALTIDNDIKTYSARKSSLHALPSQMNTANYSGRLSNIDIYRHEKNSIAGVSDHYGLYTPNLVPDKAQFRGPAAMKNLNHFVPT